MDNSELAKLMLEYDDTHSKLEEIGEKISAEIFARGETVVVGNVRATFNEGKRVFDWPQYAYLNGVLPEDTHIKTSIDWRKVCQDAELDMTAAPVASKSESSVTIKVKKGDKNG